MMLIEAINITKSFVQGNKEKIVLDSLSLSIKQNEIISINGPSGVGKSTLLYIVGALDSPDSGRVEIDGVNINSQDKAKVRSENIGFLFQNHYLLPQLTVYENIELATYVSGNNKSSNGNIINLLNYFNLKHLENEFPSNISGGEKQRIAFIRAIVNQPKLVIADEPTGNLDSKNTETLISIIQEYNKDFGISFLIATHDSLVTKKSHRQLYIERGKLV